MFDFATRHFLVLSFFLVVVSAALSMVTLGAYLAVFDWNLIWLIEYSDVTKLMLVGVAIASSIATTLIYQIQDAYSWLIKGSKYWKRVLLVAVAVIVIAPVGIIAYDLYAGRRVSAYYPFRTMSSLLFIFLAYYVFKEIRRISKGEFIPITGVIAILTLLLGLVGSAYGYYVKDISRQTHDVQTKDNSFVKARIILFLSHHIALVSEKNVVVLRTSDVSKITSELIE